MRTINEGWKDDPELIKQNMLLLGQQSVQALFNGYYFDYSIQGTQSSTVSAAQDTAKEVKKAQLTREAAGAAAAALTTAIMQGGTGK